MATPIGAHVLSSERIKKFSKAKFRTQPMA